MKVGILINPKHGHTMRAYSELVEIIRRSHTRYRSATTTKQWPGVEQASKLLDWGADLIVILGGDGTLRVSAPVLASANVPVLIIPTGTANVLSRHLGIRSTRQALQLVQKYLDSPFAPRCEVPVNVADCFTEAGPRREHFLSLAGIGGDARAVSGRTRLPTGLGWGILGYAYGAGRALFAPLISAHLTTPQSSGPPRQSSGPPRQSPGGHAAPGAESDSQPNELPLETTTANYVWSVMASKTARPAGPIPVFDRARPTAAKFELLAVELSTTKPGDRLGEWALIGWSCVNRRPAAHAAMHYWQGTEASITLDDPAPVQLDGDLIGDCRRLDLRAGTTALTIITAN
ncbi:diacylglycerol/lipid kinase family protein [Brevibacterium aurantiacum]|uniref:DAGKc domain-containing protein n=1 Tax=Brevibacterium aurantiacum TaxID=273384 RepID=A0A2A3ZMT5_BREAU|nr:diacylglycerol kinase family protein [Brevibacterium aurantiacum]MDN5550029.1 NAD(+)/NADH kinase [Brevibacterium sp.]MDN5711748.1 NAD(+)/NADH kinase [Brevibacterium aurantiacum]MDN5736166.1 NAD(+)/NADH kinase [Brevibacterium aurantiacum]MDN5737829.1 NAD(+)/NADH kinase [Brevibacterium aurantiacum]MDN5773463.1 NAD(+)/NADH kinase [Brevibacterium aurantiacum]